MPDPYPAPLSGRGIASPSRRMLRTAREEITRPETWRYLTKTPVLRYREGMSASQASRWSRTALALAFLFASLPVAGKLILGAWGFQDATLLSCLCFILAAYLHIRERRSFRTVPDDAALLDQAIQLAASGQSEEGIALLTEAIRLSPRLWQAFQYRGELYLQRGSVDAALQDFNQAIALAPDEPHICVLRGYAQSLLQPPATNLP